MAICQPACDDRARPAPTCVSDQPRASRQRQRIVSQIDMLDNLVLGQPRRLREPARAGESLCPGRRLRQHATPPTAGLNSFQNSVAVKRAWGEYATPLGQLRFGRMPSHWGLGILENSGDTYDSIGSRRSIASCSRPASSRSTSISPAPDFRTKGDERHRQARSAVSPRSGAARRREPVCRDDRPKARSRACQARSGAESGSQWRRVLRVARSVPGSGDALGARRDVQLGTNAGSSSGYVRRGLKEYVPDLWLQLLYQKFRFEAEGVMVAGRRTASRHRAVVVNQASSIRRGFETEFRAIEDRLRLQFGFGWASGDPGLVPRRTVRTRYRPVGRAARTPAVPAVAYSATTRTASSGFTPTTASISS